MTYSNLPALTLHDLRALVPNEGVWQRGLRLFQRGGVQFPVRRGRRLAGQVPGSGEVPYRVEATPPLMEGLRWEWHCTCYYFEHGGVPCKHMVALLIAWVEQPDHFEEERALDEEMAGTERDAVQADRLLELRAHPVVSSLLALEPERKRPLGRALDLDPFRLQLDYAARKEAAHLWEGILQSAAGYLRIRDAANALRLTTLLVERLLAQPTPPARLRAITQRALLLLEASALEANLPTGERAAWLAQVQRWWTATESLQLRDRLLDLILYTYAPTDEDEVVGWLRGLLHTPRHHNRRSSAAWRVRIVRFLLAHYEAAQKLDAFEQLCWEEGEDARAAYTLAQAGEVARALRIAGSGLGNSDAHRSVAEVLFERGETEEARRVAERGLRYDDEGRAPLLAWLAHNAPTPQMALDFAQAAWAAQPTAAHFRLLREAATSLEQWEMRVRTVMEEVATLPIAERVMILAEVERYDEAIALLPEAGWQQEALAERLAQRLAGDRPSDAITLWVGVAAQRASERSRPAYRRAAEALRSAQTVAQQSGEIDEWTDALAQFRAEHSRLRALWEEVDALLGPPP